MKADDLHWKVGPKLHGTGESPRSYAISDAVIDFIDGFVTAESRTLETGAGVSTVLFALKQAYHTCIVPFTAEVEGIRTFCVQNGLSVERINFVVDRSEHALPKLTGEPLDLVLIDGNHGFPVPMIDAYLTADRMRVGGMMILDDTEIWTVNLLKQFLAREPEWEIELDLWPRSVVFRRTKDGSIARNAFQQPFVVEKTIELLYPHNIEMIRAYVDPAVMEDVLARLKNADRPAGD